MSHPPWKHLIDSKVRYNNPHLGWTDTPYRVIARTYWEVQGLADMVQYTIVPWKPCGAWRFDRPTSGVWEHDLEVIDAPAPLPSPLQEAHMHLDAALAILRGMAPPANFAGVWMPQLAAQGAANALHKMAVDCAVEECQERAVLTHTGEAMPWRVAEQFVRERGFADGGEGWLKRGGLWYCPKHLPP